MPSRWWRAFFLSLLFLPSLHSKVILFITQDIYLKDLLSSPLPAFSYLSRTASWGLVSMGRRRVEQAIPALGAGTYPAIRLLDLSLGFDAQELYQGVEARYVFYTRTGILPSPRGVVHLGIYSLQQQNEKQWTGAKLGALGTEMRGKGLKTAIIGNSDGEQPQRMAVLVACDENGLVPLGKVGADLLKIDPVSPANKSIDLWKFKEALETVKDADFIVIDSGEMQRLAQYAPYLAPQGLERGRKYALQKVDALLGEVLKTLGEKDFLLFLSLCGAERGKPLHLSPLALLGKGWEGGILTSPTTRHRGLLSLLDIPPTILSLLNLPIPAYMSGKPARFCQGDKNLLLQLDNISSLNGEAQLPLLALFLFFFFLSALLFVFFHVEPLLVFSLLFPISFLFLPLFNPQNLLIYILLSLFLNACLFLLLLNFSRLLHLALFPSLLLFSSLAIIGDALTGGNLSFNSVLSLYPLGGLRFYGIGNEYSGILLISLPFAVGYLTRRDWGILASLLFGASLLRCPFWGANLGASIAFLSFFLLFSYYKGKGIFYKMLALSLLLLIAFFLLEISLPGKMSHIGAFFASLGGGESGNLYLILRKLRMNLALISSPLWKVAMAFLAGLFILSLLRGIKLKTERRNLFWAGVLSTLVAFAVNDSGGVFALFSLQYLLSAFLWEGRG